MHDILVTFLADTGPWAVVALAVIVFAETGILAGFFLPGDSMLFAVGVLVSSGVIDVPLVVVIATVAASAFLGDQLGYTIGRRFGPKVLNRPGSRFLSPTQISRAEVFFEQHGRLAVVVARFVSFARTFTPVIAGVGHMPRSRYVTYSAIGGIAWAGSLISAGALLGGVQLVADHVELVGLALVALSMSPVVASVWKARRRQTSSVVASPGSSQEIRSA